MSKLHYFFIFFILFSSCKKEKMNPSGLPKQVTVTDINNQISCVIDFYYDSKNRLTKEVIQQIANPYKETYTFGYIDDQIQVKYNIGNSDFTFTYIVDVQTKKILKRINTFRDNSYKYVYEYKPESQKPFSLYYFYYDSNNNLVVNLFGDLEFNTLGQCSKIINTEYYSYYGQSIMINYKANKDEFGINTTLVKFMDQSSLLLDPFQRIDDSSDPLFIGLTGFNFYNSGNLIDNFRLRYMSNVFDYKNHYQFDNDKLVSYTSSITNNALDSAIINNKVVIEYN